MTFRLRRPALALLVAALLLGGLTVHPPTTRALSTWLPAAPRTSLPEGDLGRPDAVTTLPDGRALITGLYFNRQGGAARGAAERYDPAADRWSVAAPFETNNGRATPTLLPGGRVLFIGGVANRGASPSSMGGLTAAQVYEPAADTWTTVAAMRTARRDHTATPLPDGTVLVVGGSSSNPFYFPNSTATVERYDPRTDRWSDAAPLAHARFGHAAALLADGRVLVFGGYGDATAERYDPATDRWSPAADLPQAAPLGWQGFVLGDGRVLALGLTYDDRQPAAAVYDPAADRWSPAAPPPPGTRTATLLPDGRLLTTGASTQLHDPAGNLRAAAPPPADPAARAATRLRDGRILLVGERGAELYTDTPAPSACFAETGQCASGRFLDYWQQHGGLARNGFPLSPVRIEVLEDGKAYQVQYFERVRLEYHPEYAAPYDILLGQFGRRVLREEFGGGGTAASPIDGADYFAETGHNLGGRFLDYWQRNGGLAQFGYPLTEELPDQRLEDGRLYTVQYFERARFERHPEHAAPYDVLLGQFGRRIMEEDRRLDGEPTLARLFLTDERVQALLGSPDLPYYPIPRPRSYQSFERGALIWWGEAVPPSIIVLCDGTPQAGDTVLVYPDTWREGAASGGGAGPRPGLYEPARGFGKLWRENQRVRDCLGYATDPDETGYSGSDHPFERGETRLAVTPAGRFIYALYGGSSLKPCYVNPTPLCRYERYPAPQP